jgi:hypothetical protein
MYAKGTKFTFVKFCYIVKLLSNGNGISGKLRRLHNEEQSIVTILKLGNL